MRSSSHSSSSAAPGAFPVRLTLRRWLLFLCFALPTQEQGCALVLLLQLPGSSSPRGCHCKFLAAAETFVGSATLRTGEWVVVGVAAVPPGHASLSFQLQNTAKESEGPPLSLTLASDADWSMLSSRLATPQPCTSWSTRFETRGQLDSWGHDRNSSSSWLDLSSSRHRRLYFLILNACFITPLATLPDASKEPAAAPISWSTSSLIGNHEHLPGDMRFCSALAALTVLLDLYLARQSWRQSSPAREHSVKALRLHLTLDALSAFGSLQHLVWVWYSGRLQVWLMTSAWVLEQFAQLALALSGVMAGLGPCCQSGHAGDGAQAFCQPVRLFLGPLLCGGLDVALRVTMRPSRLGPLASFLERSRIVNTGPRVLASCIVSAAIGVVSVLTVVTWRQRCFHVALLALLGPPTFRLTMALVPIYSRPLVGAAVRLLLNTCTTILTLRSTSLADEARGASANPQPLRRVVPLGDFLLNAGGVVGKRTAAVPLPVVPKLALALLGVLLLLRLLNLRVQVQGASARAEELHTSCIRHNEDQATDAATVAQRIRETRLMDLGTQEIVLTAYDVPRYPFAGMLSPCLFGSEGVDVLPPPTRKEYRTCAVVGAAPVSDRSGTGEDIDGHETVFRAGVCNPDKLKNKKKDLGAKQSFCVSSNLDSIGSSVRYIYPLKTWAWLTKTLALNKLKWESCGRNLLVLHPGAWSRWEQWVEVWAQHWPKPAESPETWRNRSIFCDPNCTALLGPEASKEQRRKCPSIINFSSGFIAVMLALELCEAVTVFGFDTNTSAQATYGHLRGHPMEAGRKTALDHPHAFPLERHMLHLWHSLGLLRLHGTIPRTSRAEEVRKSGKSPRRDASASVAGEGQNATGNSSENALGAIEVRAYIPEACIRRMLNPPEQHRRFSSLWKQQQQQQQQQPPLPRSNGSRSMLSSELPWKAATLDRGQFIELDLGSKVPIVGAIVQGWTDTAGSEWVQTYTAEVQLHNWSSWVKVGGTFHGPSAAGGGEVEAVFPTVHAARYLRLYPETWQRWISMRVAALVCVTPSSTQPRPQQREYGEDPSRWQAEPAK